jgi:hypothetical protein
MRTQNLWDCTGLRDGKASCRSLSSSALVTSTKLGYARRESRPNAQRGLSRVRPKPSPQGTPSRIGTSRLDLLGHRPGAIAFRSTAVRRSVIQHGHWWGLQATASSIGTKRVDFSGPRTRGTASRVSAVMPAALQRGDRTSAQATVSSIGTTTLDFSSRPSCASASSAISPAAVQRFARKCVQATVSSIRTTSLDFNALRLRDDFHPCAIVSESDGAPR